MRVPSKLPLRHPDWLVQLLIDRCKEGGFVDREDLALIVSLNLEGDTSGQEYGEIVQKLGMAVVAKGGILAVPNLEDYDQTEFLTAPSDWLERWSNEETQPDRYELGAAFDYATATTPDGRPLLIDGPGAHTFEAFQAHENERSRVLEKRRLQRNSTRSGKPET